MPEAEQWVETTRSRSAGDGYAWMQSVHWVHAAGVFVPSRKHGPKFGPTTLEVARELARLSPCRPGIAYLARKLRVGERTVHYHLEMLRQAGLLAYRLKGTRRRQDTPLASEFELVIPPAFDEALGIRTVDTGIERRPCGIAPEGEALIGRLGKLAARTLGKSRRKSRRSRPSDGASAVTSRTQRCTPMRGSSCTSSTTGTSPRPPESKLASGTRHSTTVSNHQPNTRKPRTLNRVGRRHQLARQLTTEVDWLARAAHGDGPARIAWIVRHVADAGWTTTDVQAWIHYRGGPKPTPDQAQRPSALLATLLRGATETIDTPHKRHEIVEDWRESRRAEHFRHAPAAWKSGWAAPRSRAVRRLVVDAVRNCFTPGRSSAVREEHRADTSGPDPTTTPAADGGAVLEAAERAELRTTAWGEYQATGRSDLVESAIATLGQTAAEGIYGRDLITRLQRLATPSAHCRIRMAA